MGSYNPSLRAAAGWDLVLVRRQVLMGERSMNMC